MDKLNKNKCSQEKLQIYLNEYNVLMDNATYLPLVSGQLQAYAQTNPLIQEKYLFMPFLFIRDNLEQIISQYQNPAVAAFSTSMWNMNLSLNVAEQIKKTFSESLIVFGGPQVPFQADDFFRAYPFIDVTVRGEGEKTFSELLTRALETRNFEGINGISYKDNKGRVIRNSERELEKKLDVFPSPYLEGIFDETINSHKDINFQTIIETDRGCPFLCSYCFWGQGGLSRKFRFFSNERVKEIAEWVGKNKIEYVFCADSNFGMFERDIKVAQHFVDAKKKHGFPEKFRTCYGKNAEENIFRVGRLLTKEGMEKGITLSRQTNNPLAAVNVRRKNIKMSVYNNLQKRYNEENIPIYTELILGLPGETYQSFVGGIEKIIQSGIKNQLFVYHCQVYPNTELADKKYQEKFEISTTRIPLTEVHGKVRAPSMVTEYEDVITSTESMPEKDWKKSMVFSWGMQLFHGLKLGFHLSNYLADCHNIRYVDFFKEIAQAREGILGKEMQKFDRTADSILRGGPFCMVVPEFGPIYWEQEEASFLNISNDREKFYKEIHRLTENFLHLNNKDFDEEELQEVIKYQEARTPDYKPLIEKKFFFNYNIPEYFDTFHFKDRSKLLRTPQVMELEDDKDYNWDKETFAKERVLRGRKSDKILRSITWFSE